MQKKKLSNRGIVETSTKKYTNENKIIDLSILPPSESTLLLHVKRTYYVAKL